MPAVHCVSFLSCPMFERCVHLACMFLVRVVKVKFQIMERQYSVH